MPEPLSSCAGSGRRARPVTVPERPTAAAIPPARYGSSKTNPRFRDAPGYASDPPMPGMAPARIHTADPHLHGPADAPPAAAAAVREPYGGAPPIDPSLSPYSTTPMPEDFSAFMGASAPGVATLRINPGQAVRPPPGGPASEAQLARARGAGRRPPPKRAAAQRVSPEPAPLPGETTEERDEREMEERENDGAKHLLTFSSFFFRRASKDSFFEALGPFFPHHPLIFLGFP